MSGIRASLKLEFAPVANQHSGIGQGSKEKSEIPYGYCHCGCGQKTKICPAKNIKYGHIKGVPFKFIRYHQPSREMAWDWKGGRTISDKGYVLIKIREHPRASKDGYYPEHIVMAEKALGRFFKKGEIVHHVDENRQNNVNSNFVICDRGYHALLHVRTASLKACGNANWRKCYVCKQYDDIVNMKESGTSNHFYHFKCLSDLGKLRHKNKKGELK